MATAAVYEPGSGKSFHAQLAVDSALATGLQGSETMSATKHAEIPTTADELGPLVAKINEAHRKCESCFNDTLAHALVAGRLLIEAKRVLKHGRWLDWIAEHCVFSARTAQGYMRLTRNAERLEDPNTPRSAHLGIDGAPRNIQDQRGHAEPESENAVSLCAVAAERPVVVAKREEKRLEVKLRREEEAQKIQYAIDNPEECPAIGQTRTGPDPDNGLMCRQTVVGQINGLPMIRMECIDSRYEQIRAGSVSYSTYQKVDGVIKAMESVERAIKKLKAVESQLHPGAYYFSWHRGAVYLASELSKQRKNLERAIGAAHLDAICGNGSPSADQPKVNPSQSGMRPGWASWGLEVS